ncbi:hypothetical protein ACH0B5_03520 [Ureibacillus sp. 179-F W5.1 NHS]|uniref:DUF7695 domain-containing protein n=1 Tax=Lysinibacillus halotolerans TaxID=1368476 RepID=A0A3M8H7U1_9BACI|nr:hypothetical protein [Lysinibacillus halotolerans]RNC98475.1 hypothetical protein EC501_10900 [Lysinibacillus halotolerans]
MRRVLVNKVRCKKCNDIIESKHEHDFKRCSCGSIFIDGGKYYQKYGWGLNQQEEKSELDDFIDFSYSVYEDD